MSPTDDQYNPSTDFALPYTGSDLVVLLAIAVVILVLGALLYRSFPR